MQINKRLFGSDIPTKVKQKLEARQKAAENTKNPLDSVLDSSYGSEEKTYKELLNNQFQGYGELSSRTPFVRMWTAISITDIIDEELEQEMRDSKFWLASGFDKKYGLDAYYVGSEQIAQFSPQEQVNIFRSKEKEAIEEHIKSLRGTVNYNMDGVRNFNTFAHEPEKSIETTKVYQITNFEGNDSYQDNMNPNNSVQEESGWAQELEDNKFLKPKSGITSVTSETEGSMGVIKKTSITFLVHNFQDFDQIYNRYFMKPGATVFIDFGWDSLREDSKLYNPMDLINSGKNTVSTNESTENDYRNIKEFLYSEGTREDGTKCKQGILHINQGDLEVLQGIVTDYDAKILPNGSVECSLTITSGNASMLENDIHTKLITKIKNIIKYSIPYIVARQFSEFEIKNYGFKYTNLKDYINKGITSISGNQPSIDDYRTLNENMFAIAAQTVGNGELTPNGDAVRTGVYIDKTSMVDTYMSIGLFEDLIINSQFGFGKSEDDINNGQNLQVRLDSSSTFTTFNKIFHEKQRQLSIIDSEKNPNVLFPDWWGNSEQDFKVKKSSAENFFQQYHDTAGDLTEKQWQDLGKGYNSRDNQTFYESWMRYLNETTNTGDDTMFQLSGLAGYGELPEFTSEQLDNLIGWRTDGTYSYEETRLESSKLPKTQHRQMILKVFLHLEQQRTVDGLYHSSNPASYSYQMGKYNKQEYFEKADYYETSDLYSSSPETGLKSGKLVGGGILADSTSEYIVEAVKSNCLQDVELNRIPIRELFVKTEVIMKALDSYTDGGNVRNVIEDVLKAIKKDTVGVVDLVISKGESDSELRLIDKQKLQVQDQMTNDVKTSTLGTNTQNEEGDFFKQLFKFNINSANSIVKNYDLNFKLPSGNIGNMYAIQASSGNTSEILPLTDRISQALSLSSLREDNKKDSSGITLPKKLVYEPYLSDYRAQQIATIDKNIGMKASFTTADELLDSGGYRTNTSAGFNLGNNADIILPETYREDTIKAIKSGKKNKEEKKKVDDGLTPEQRKAVKEREELERQEKLSLQKQEENYRFAKELNEQAGQTFVDSYTDYFNLLLNVNVKTVQTPTLLPLELVLTTYGISTIQPGDIFRVDYLPKVYAKNVYFQVIKVSHQIDKTGWNTTLETQFRIVPGKTSFKQIRDEDVVYDKKMIEINNFMNADFKDPGGKLSAENFTGISNKTYKLMDRNTHGAEGTTLNTDKTTITKHGAYYFTCTPAYIPTRGTLNKNAGQPPYKEPEKTILNFGNRDGLAHDQKMGFKTVRGGFAKTMLTSMTQITPMREILSKYKHITDLIKFKWLIGKDSFAQPNRLITFPVHPDARYVKLANEEDTHWSTGDMKRSIENAYGYGCPWYCEPLNKTPGKAIHEEYPGSSQWQFRNGDIFSYGSSTSTETKINNNIQAQRLEFGAFRNKMLDDRVDNNHHGRIRGGDNYRHWAGWFIPEENIFKSNETVYWDDPNNSLSNGAGSYANFIILAGNKNLLADMNYYLIIQKINGKGHWAIVSNLNHIKRYDFPINAVYDGPETGLVNIPVGNGVEGCWNPNPVATYDDKGTTRRFYKGPWAPPHIVPLDGYGAPDLTVNFHTNGPNDYTPPDIPKPAPAPSSGGSVKSYTHCCFLPEQLITMGDGTQIPIIDINVGDEVLQFDETDGKTKSSGVNEIEIINHDDVYELYLSNGKILKPTGNHPFLEKTKNWVTIDGYNPNHAGGKGYLKEGDYVKDIQDGWVKVIKTKPIKGNYDAYNFVGQDYGTIIADGIVTHNTSDIRLKENIELIGKSNLGINIYEFDYIDKSYGDGRYRGVMAQEVLWASIKDSDGYYMVDYSKVDVPFEKIN